MTLVERAVMSLQTLTFVPHTIPTAMTLIIEVAEDKLESVRAVLAQTDGVQAVTESEADKVDDWDDEDGGVDDDNEWVPRTREERIRDIKHAIQEVNAHRAGKIELPLAKDVLRDL